MSWVFTQSSSIERLCVTYKFKCYKFLIFKWDFFALGALFKKTFQTPSRKNKVGSIKDALVRNHRLPIIISFNFFSSSDICSPLTEVEPDYSTDNSDEDADKEDDDENVRIGAIEDGNIYEQVRIHLAKSKSL